MEKVQVLYLAGTMRSGSTILGRLLGELPEAFHAGEIDHMTRAFSGVDIRCECRELAHECGFWQAAVTQAFGTLSSTEFAALRATRDEYRLRTLPRLLLRSVLSLSSQFSSLPNPDSGRFGGPCCGP